MLLHHPCVRNHLPPVPLPDRTGGVEADLPPLAADDEGLLVGPVMPVLIPAADALTFGLLPWADGTVLVVVLAALLPWADGTVWVIVDIMVFDLLPLVKEMAVFGLLLPAVGPGLVMAGGGLGTGGMGVGTLGLVPAWDRVEVLGPPLKLVFPLLWMVVAGTFTLFSTPPEVMVAVGVLVASAGENNYSISLSYKVNISLK